MKKAVELTGLGTVGEPGEGRFQVDLNVRGIEELAEQARNIAQSEFEVQFRQLALGTPIFQDLSHAKNRLDLFEKQLRKAERAAEQARIDLAAALDGDDLTQLGMARAKSSESEIALVASRGAIEPARQRLAELRRGAERQFGDLLIAAGREANLALKPQRDMYHKAFGEALAKMTELSQVWLFNRAMNLATFVRAVDGTPVGGPAYAALKAELIPSPEPEPSATSLPEPTDPAPWWREDQTASANTVPVAVSD